VASTVNSTRRSRDDTDRHSGFGVRAPWSVGGPCRRIRVNDAHRVEDSLTTI
jgi:hypothetical protein